MALERNQAVPRNASRPRKLAISAFRLLRIVPIVPVQNPRHSITRMGPGVQQESGLGNAAGGEHQSTSHSPQMCSAMFSKSVLELKMPTDQSHMDSHFWWKKYRVLWETNLCQEGVVSVLLKGGRRKQNTMLWTSSKIVTKISVKTHKNHYWHLGQLEAHSLGCVRSHGIGWSHPRTGVLPMIWRWWTLADQKKTRKVCEENVVRVMDSAMVWGNTCFHLDPQVYEGKKCAFW